jgi:hypothetical protein
MSSERFGMGVDMRVAVMVKALLGSVLDWS